MMDSQAGSESGIRHSAFGTTQQRWHRHLLDRRDLFPLQVLKWASFVAAGLGLILQVLTSNPHNDIERDLRLWTIGALLFGGYASHLLDLKRRINALEERLGLKAENS